MKKLYIVTSASDVYKEYIPTFIESIRNLEWMTSYGFEIHVVLMTDEDFETNSKYPLYKIHIPNLPYSLFAMTKTDFCFDALMQCKINNEDYFIWADIDTYFRYLTDNKKLTLIEYFKQDKVCFARTPWCFIEGIRNENEQCKNTNWYIENLDTCTQWVQNSLFFSKFASYKEFYKEHWMIVQNNVNNLNGCPVIPFMHDQTSTNKVISFDYSKYIIGDFVFNGYEDIYSPINNPEVLNKTFDDQTYISANSGYDLSKFSTIFAIQKFNSEIKKTKRIPPFPF